MADITNSSGNNNTNNPQGHGNTAAGRSRSRGSSGRATGGGPGRGAHRGQGPESRGRGRGNSGGGGVSRGASHANADRGGGGRGGGRGRRGGGPRASAGGSSQRGGHDTGMGGRRAWTPLTPSRPTTLNSSYSSFGGSAAPELSAAQIEEFLEVALSTVAASPEKRQSFVNSLATEGGLAKIRQIVEADFSLSYSVLGPMFYPHCVLFLRLISCDEIRNSLVLENAVGTIYNFVYGYDGSRGTGFFRKVAKCLVQARPEAEGGEVNDTMSGEQYKEALLVATKALLSTLRLNQGASVQEAFGEVVQQLCNCYQVEDIHQNLTIHSAHQNILKIKEVLSIGDVISISNASASRTTITNSQQQQPGRGVPLYSPELDIDLPGSLSNLGPRHDNDHALISDIRILPTISEILCDQRTDFLPARQGLNSPTQHHEAGILRLIDTQFRLLREDTSGLLRDSIRLILENWAILVQNSDWRARRRILRDGCPTPVRMYSSVEIQRIKPDSKRGMEIAVEFDQVHRARNPSQAKRYQWWRESRELREGAVLALISRSVEGDVAVIFLLVSKRDITHKGHGEHQSSSSIQRIGDLAGDAKRAMILLRLANPTYEDQSNLINLASNNRQPPPPSAQLILFEFPAVLYNSFEGVLRCLQFLHKNPASIPFTTWLTPRVQNSASIQTSTTAFTSGSTPTVIVPPPPYLLNQTIDLSCIPTSTTNNSNPTTLAFSPSKDPHELSIQLSENTALDTGQAVAMTSALRHEVALIQGPPGTGKSFVGIQIARCLLKNRDLLKLGPILCVCYTNHALDQFLNELLDSGVNKILRMGSRSQSPRLEALSLDNYKNSKQTPRTRGLGTEIKAFQRILEGLVVEIKDVCRQAEGGTTEIVRRFLEKRFLGQAKSIFGVMFKGGGDGLSSGQGVDDAMNAWVVGDAPDHSGGIERSVEQLLLVDVWTLTNSERARLNQFWLDSAFAEISQQLHHLMQSHSATKQQLTALFHRSDRQILDQVHVVGVTTTGLANNSDFLRSLPARVLICEEAGEVLESHVLTALLPSIQHAILIGDHLQLRPRISNLALSMEYDRKGPRYNLDESLFERLANSRFRNANINGWDGEGEGESSDRFPVAQLDHQRRMHPSISSLIRETLYPSLRDHPSTAIYPDIPGMKRRLFWLDHRNFEDASDPTEPMQSKTNRWEAEMVTALVRHLCRQGGYNPGEIAVLTPYLGQLRILRDLLEEVVELVIAERDLEDLDDSEVEAGASNSGQGSVTKCPQGRQQQQQAVEKGKLSDRVRMASVDNFQGEEATVVIVSLVRSNAHQNCGFLKTPNRINVLLSRAKHGMYIIGDANTSSHVAMWKCVIKLLQGNSNIGRKLELHCSRHPNNKIYVSSPEDFAIRAPEGGCAETCELRLDCGHRCAVKCHSKTLHNAVKCMELCMKMRECGHSCSKRCSASCGRCREKVLSVLLPCGHTAKEVECQHMENLSLVKCGQLVVRGIPGCDHQVRVPCHASTMDIKCSNLCGNLLPCGHSCGKSCEKCTRIGDDGVVYMDHDSCNILCGRVFTTCSHTCAQECHPGTPCPPCKRPCEVRCKHSRCPKKCSDPCPPCAEQCGWSCDHRRGRCNMPCAVPCDIIPCDRRCEKRLAVCGHQCPGVCGELCPDSKFCQDCCASDIRERNADLIMFENYSQINIDEDPLIFLSCGHFYTVSSLDGVMELNQHYVVDSQTDKILHPKPFPRIVASGSSPKGCPECRMPLRNIDRYNRVVKKALLDESTRRFAALANLMCAELVGEIQKREMEIEDERSAFVREWPQSASESRDLDRIESSVKAYTAKGYSLLRRINKFAKSVAKTEQPFGRVNDMFASSAARRQDLATNTFELDESVIQTGFQFRGQCLSFRLTWAILWDFDTISCNNAVDPRIRSALRDAITSQLKSLLGRCLSIKNSSQDAKLPQHEAEARIYHALFSMLSLSNSRAQGQEVDDATESATRQCEKESLEECETLCSRYPGTLAHLKDDVKKAKRLVDGGTFYSFVTTEETREVYKAMALQFSGTGHWYYCRNGHPFTVGECGMPMEEARCPQCEEPIGGHDHTPVQGVQRAEDLEARFGGSG